MHQSATIEQQQALRFAIAMAIGLFLLPRLGAAEVKDTPCTQIDACRIHSQAGTRFFVGGSFGDALREFSNAYAEQPDPRLLINIGRSLHMLGRFREALKYYQRCQDAIEQDISLDKELSLRLSDYLAQTHAKIQMGAPDSSPAEAPSQPVDKVTPNEIAPVAGRAQRQASAAEDKRDGTILKPNEPMRDETAGQASVLASPSAAASCSSDGPVYKKWWFWSAIGASTLGLGLGLGLGLRPTGESSIAAQLPALTYAPSFSLPGS